MSSLSSAGSSTDIQNLSKSFPTLLLNLFSFNCFPFGTYCINPGSLPNGGILITGFPVLFSRDCGNWSLEILEMRSESPLDFTGMEISTNTARYIPAIVSLVIPTTPRRGWCLTHTALGALWQKCPIMPFRQSLAYFVMTCRTSRTFLTNDQLQRALIKCAKFFST